MAFVKSGARAAEKFVQAASQRQQEYNDGVANPRTPWAQATAAAEANYKAGVAAAANAGRFGRGVARAGDAKYLKGAKEKGGTRFAAGVAQGREAYQQGVEPYLQKIGSTTLPPRYPRRDPRNLARVAAIATALGQLKEQSSK